MSEKKTCTGCIESKPFNEFGRDRKTPDGLNFRCKTCCRAATRQYKANNPQYLERQRQRYAENPAVHINEARRWRQANTEKAAATAKAWREGSQEHIRDYRKSNAHQSWVGSYRTRCTTLGLAPVIEDFTKSDVIAAYGDACAYCDDGAFEHLDHFVPVCAGGPHTLANVRPSCASCNSAKRSQLPENWEASR